VTPGDTLGGTRSQPDAFILYPLAPFDALNLGSKRLLELVRNEASVVGQLRAMVGAAGRRAPPSSSPEPPLLGSPKALSPPHGSRGVEVPLGRVPVASWPRIRALPRVPRPVVGLIG